MTLSSSYSQLLLQWFSTSLLSVVLISVHLMKATDISPAHSELCCSNLNFYMLSGELQRFFNEINSENNKSDIITRGDITFVIFTFF